MKLQAERVQLDPLEPGDFAFFAKLHLSEAVTKYLSPPRPLSEAECFRLFCLVLGHAQMRGFGYWAVRRRTDQTWLGVVGLWFPEGWPGVELGWRLEPEHWGHGYATEAARAVFDYGRETLDLTELISIIHTDNDRSARLARRLGMDVWKTRRVGDVDVSIFRWQQVDTDDIVG